MIDELTRQRALKMESALYRLMMKFHIETECGNPYHWRECERFCEVLGFDSWEDVKAAAEADLVAELDAQQ